MPDTKGTKKVQVTFTNEQWDLIKNLKGSFGDNNADVVRTIVLAWLAEKSFISEVVKEKMDSLER
ncbi:CopG family transcriptional regulator [candidate division MSBL1 archaeon SCGC-AAA259I14]|uniref:CopG family transcriptional regulator n=1 Tax=candidate division MSBL1 archaeon SCGC-AAA259I14 TaxID=1698268 RepID=A0A133UQD2_9EURY|nr:CopG family transcriptional regulator [candidate division MSBL1 archaeon SCGC-AAA259I14]